MWGNFPTVLLKESINRHCFMRSSVVVQEDYAIVLQIAICAILIPIATLAFSFCPHQRQYFLLRSHPLHDDTKQEDQQQFLFVYILFNGKEMRYPPCRNLSLHQYVSENTLNGFSRHVSFFAISTHINRLYSSIFVATIAAEVLSEAVRGKLLVTYRSMLQFKR